jgi:hypothetical protein
MRSISVVPSLVLTIAVAATGSACMHAKAAAVADSPPLDMPPPPPRVVETVEGTPLPPAPLAEEPPRQEVRPPVRRTPRADRGGDLPRPDAQKPDTKPEGSAEAPRAVEDQPKPAATLQTTPAVAEGELERTIRGSLSRAAADLGRVDYRSLSRDGRTQYDTAKRFIEQAEEAMEPRTRNLLFARSLAEKAQVLAQQLAGR